MAEQKEIFDRSYPENDGILNCLDESVLADAVKRTDMATYSLRAADFSEDQMLSLSPEEERLLAPLSGVPSEDFILELAGGNGRFALHLLRRGHRVIETDIAHGSVERVRRTALDAGLTNGLYAIVDAERLPFRDGSLGAVFMVASLHHLPHPDVAIREIARVLKPGGRLLILREPASWQYYLFLPAYWLVRKFLRRRNQNAFSLADDVTWGFSCGRLRSLLKKDFGQIEIRPVHYLRKFYRNWVVLRAKLGRPSRVDPAVERRLETCDGIIARIPLLNRLPWDWDISAVRKS
ncbi:class I SAM-dependent methyltransferase [Candidatus Uhrbacteria bacterium]|nr:class I SAM-dependent methyltransferase [Candidatus Uhrbacteria bacterium]